MKRLDTLPRGDTTVYQVSLNYFRGSEVLGRTRKFTDEQRLYNVSPFDGQIKSNFYSIFYCFLNQECLGFVSLIQNNTIKITS